MSRRPTWGPHLGPTHPRLFTQAGIIESWGSGTMRMIEACRGAGRPSPVWESEVEGLRLVLPSPQTTPEVTPEVTGLVSAAGE